MLNPLPFGKLLVKSDGQSLDWLVLRTGKLVDDGRADFFWSPILVRPFAETGQDIQTSLTFFYA